MENLLLDQERPIGHLIGHLTTSNFDTRLNLEVGKHQSFYDEVGHLKLGSVMLFRNTFCYTGWNDPAILRVVNT